MCTIQYELQGTQKCTKIKKERRNEYGEYDENVYYRR